MRIRDAVDSDVAAIAAIYNDAVANTTAIWNETTVDAADRLEWLAARRRSGYPVIVAVDDNDVALGYATFADWRPHDGYRHTVEHSVYIRGDVRGGGLGTALIVELLDRARRLGKHVMVAGIDASNAGSITVHERIGFRQVGTLPQVGTKFGRWLDLVFLQIELDDRTDPDAF